MGNFTAPLGRHSLSLLQSTATSVHVTVTCTLETFPKLP